MSLLRPLFNYVKKKEECLPKQVLYLIWRNPWMTVSNNTYISRMLALINWITVGHQDNVRYPKIVPSSDFIQSEKIDLVLFSSEPFPFKKITLTNF